MSSKHRFLDRLLGSLPDGSRPVFILQANQRRRDYFAVVIDTAEGKPSVLLMRDDNGALKPMTLTADEATPGTNLERHLRTVVATRFPGARFDRVLDKTVHDVRRRDLEVTLASPSFLPVASAA